MRYAIFSDIHSNLEAFTSVIDAYKNESIDKYFCVGDIVGYGANPNECMELTRQLTDIIVAGNHDWAAAGKFNTSYFNPPAKSAIEWTEKQLNLEDKNFLDNLGLVYNDQEMCLVHGTLINPGDFDYILDIYAADRNFRILEQKILFIGHSHIPGIFVKRPGEILYKDEIDIKLRRGEKYIINVGSVGQPRDRDNRACLCVFDTEKRLVEIKRVVYEIETTQKKILKAGLPEFLSARLALGN